MSDPEIPDRARTGDDLLARIDELTKTLPDGADGNGWRYLLFACGAEIGRLRGEVIRLQYQIDELEECDCGECAYCLQKLDDEWEEENAS